MFFGSVEHLTINLHLNFSIKLIKIWWNIFCFCVGNIYFKAFVSLAAYQNYGFVFVCQQNNLFTFKIMAIINLEQEIRANLEQIRVVIWLNSYDNCCLNDDWRQSNYMSGCRWLAGKKGQVWIKSLAMI